MNDSTDAARQKLASEAWTTGLWQGGFGLILSFALACWLGLISGVSCLFGVALMFLNNLWLARRIADSGSLDAEGAKRLLYVGAVVRFFVLLIAMLLAYALGLHLLFVAAGIFLAQVVVFVRTALVAKREADRLRV